MDREGRRAWQGEGPVGEIIHAGTATPSSASATHHGIRYGRPSVSSDEVARTAISLRSDKLCCRATPEIAGSDEKNHQPGLKAGGSCRRARLCGVHRPGRPRKQGREGIEKENDRGEQDDVELVVADHDLRIFRRVAVRKVPRVNKENVGLDDTSHRLSVGSRKLMPKAVWRDQLKSRLFAPTQRCDFAPSPRPTSMDINRLRENHTDAAGQFEQSVMGALTASRLESVDPNRRRRPPQHHADRDQTEGGQQQSSTQQSLQQGRPPRRSPCGGRV